MTPIDLGPVAMQALLEAVAEFGGVTELVSAARGSRPSGRRQPVPFKTAGEVLDAHAARLLTRDEARRLLGQRASRRTTR